MNNTQFQFKVLDGFEDAKISSAIWNELVRKSSSDVIFLTWQWQKVWWEVFGRGKLLLIVAEQNDMLITIAPLFADGQMIFFVGSGGSDYLNFIGKIDDANIIEGILSVAIKKVPDFLGFRFYHVADQTATGTVLFAVAEKMGYKLFDEGELPSPRLELKKFPVQSLEATKKKSLIRHENWFKKNGDVKVEHLKTFDEILPHLEEFFEQHIKRWEPTSYPSLFLDPIQKLFYKRLSEEVGETGWLRFTCVNWNKENVAFHFGFNYNGTFLWYKPTYEISVAKHSPGEVLLRQLLLQAINENAIIFDFGLGDEDFKKRFSTNTQLVRTWGLYPL